MEEQNRQHHHSTHEHHHHDQIHDFRKRSMNRIHKRKIFAKVAYWLLFMMAILSIIMVIIVYKFL